MTLKRFVLTTIVVIGWADFNLCVQFMRHIRLRFDDDYESCHYGGTLLMTNVNSLDTVSDWKDYRRIKLRLIVLLMGWVPFGVIIGALLPKVLHTYTPTYVLAIAYTLAIGYTWLQYGFYPCPKCGLTLRGRQLYCSTCPKCGNPINK